MDVQNQTPRDRTHNDKSDKVDEPSALSAPPHTGADPEVRVEDVEMEDLSLTSTNQKSASQECTEIACPGIKPKKGKPSLAMPWDCSDIRLDPDFEERMEAHRKKQEKQKELKEIQTRTFTRETTTMVTTTSGENRFIKRFHKRYPLKDTSNAVSVLLPSDPMPKSFKLVING